MWTILMTLLVYTGLSFATESLFTGTVDTVRAYLQGRPVDLRFPCRTQLWGVFVYGVSATVSFPLISLLLPAFYGLPWAVRGVAYMLGIYAWEFFWGFVQESTIGFCTWRYRDSPYRILRYNSPMHGPFWFLFGFVLEWTWLTFIPALMAAM